MMAQKEEPARIAGLAEVDDHHTVFGWLDPDLDVPAHRDGFLIGQIADEHRVLNPLTVTFDACCDVPEPAVLADVIGDQVPAAGHGSYLVTSGSYCGSSPVRYAARIRACSSTARR